MVNTIEKEQRSKRMISIHFKKLFGRFNYDVILNEDGLTILTGPNGYGKSTILKSIEAMRRELLGVIFFFSLDFEEITAVFENNQKISILKIEDNLVINGILVQNDVFKEGMDAFLDRRPYMTRIDDDTWFDRRRGIRIGLNEYIERIYLNERYGQDSNEAIGVADEELIVELKKMKTLIGEIYFIGEQRLIRENKTSRDEQEVINVIDELPDNFKELMGAVLADYSSTSNKLDSTYPNRLFTNEEKISEQEYKEKMAEMNIKFEKLNKYDLSNMQASANFIFKEEHAKALKIYFDDFEQKYKVYEDFINKLDMYTDIINNRLTFKKIKISRNDGINVVDDKGKELRLSQLSSGEKQEIVLFYDLIFGTKNNVLLMIDEPEISLHIIWQKKFMDDLLKIILYKKINVIVATHSPQIINNHWDRQIDLGALYGEQFDKE